MSEGMAGSHAPKGRWMAVFSLPVIVAALGYFVDIYDLVDLKKSGQEASS